MNKVAYELWDSARTKLINRIIERNRNQSDEIEKLRVLLKNAYMSFSCGWCIDWDEIYEAISPMKNICITHGEYDGDRCPDCESKEQDYDRENHHVVED